VPPVRRARSRPPDERSAGAVVWRRGPDGVVEVCLIRVGGAWSLPKGIIDPGETVEEAALREVAEETGLPRQALVPGASLPASEYAYRRHDTGRLVFKRVDHLLVELDEPAAPLLPQADEVDDAAWFPLTEARSRVAYRDLRDTLSEAARLLSGAAEVADA
jgi:8-oxo-dGTP pyrophosphatase MutT (NUDIX family)